MVAVYFNWGIFIMKEDYNEKIKRYYNDSQILYRLFWMNKRNLAMHYGFWDKDTKNLHEALINENKAVAEALDIQKDDIILDAGCGVGGTAIWIAENYGVKVTGIGIVKKQNELAKKYAKERGLESLVNFQIKDFCDTGLASESFDKIYAIESVCHAKNKDDFIKEAFRLLKPGGMLCVCDYFLNRLNNMEDKYHYEMFCEGWAMPGLAQREDFENYLIKNNYESVTFIDNTDKTLKSSYRMYKMSKRWLYIDKFLNLVRIVSDENVVSTEASLSQYHFFKENIGFHGLFYAQKPLQ